MELNWTTFALEIINFLVLVWILKHFLFKPVQDVIARRKADVEKTLNDAKTLQNNAEQLKAQYENRLADWEKERQKAQVELNKEIEQERLHRIDDLHNSLESERKKNAILQQRYLQKVQREMEIMALEQAASFSSKILSAASCPELESRLIDLALDELSLLSPERVSQFSSTMGKSLDQIVVTSAFSMNADKRLALEKSLRTILQLNLPVQYEQDESLLAGLQINIGAWVLRINLKDELKAFTEFALET